MYKQGHLNTSDSQEDAIARGPTGRDSSSEMDSYIQYDGSKDDLDWRIDFRYFNFILLKKKIYVD